MTSTSTASVIRQTGQTHKGPTYIFSFGDSYTSTNFDINGEQPSKSNPLGNNDLGNGETSAQGPVWIEFLSTKYRTSEVLTYNFAVGGASIPDNYTYQIQNLYQPKYTTSPKFWLSSNTLFTSWIGINDVSDAWLKKNATVLKERIDLYEKRLEELYRTGARKFFVVNNPPLDRSPFILGDGPSESSEHYKEMVQVFNEGLGRMIDGFRGKFEDVTILLYDVHTFFSGVLDNPTKYGFKNNSCQDGEGCLWSGSFHILSAFHDVIAKDMAETVKKFQFS